MLLTDEALDVLAEEVKDEYMRYRKASTRYSDALNEMDMARIESSQAWGALIDVCGGAINAIRVTEEFHVREDDK